MESYVGWEDPDLELDRFDVDRSVPELWREAVVSGGSDCAKNPEQAMVAWRRHPVGLTHLRQVFGECNGFCRVVSLCGFLNCTVFLHSCK